MEVIRIPSVVRDTVRELKHKSHAIGFVPTMGSLHEGHLSLIRAARRENRFTVASIFVNPLQFGPSEDLDNYPRHREADEQKLRAEDVDMLFAPDGAHMYPDGFCTSVLVGGLSEKLCGPFRPGHFEGVATMVAKLLNIVSPTRAYFGMKDFQQALIIKRMVRDLDMDVEVILCPTVREPGGLAMSSRNQYLSPPQRAQAGAVHESLGQAAAMIKQGVTSVAGIKADMARVLEKSPLITEVQYASAYDPDTLEELEEIPDGKALLAAAVKMGDVRLIDNILL